MRIKAILARMRHSHEALRAARHLFQQELYNDSTSRAHYSIIYAARAALLVHEVISKSHKGLQQLFGKVLVREGRIEPEYGRI